jgi:hypothetical protein
MKTRIEGRKEALIAFKNVTVLKGHTNESLQKREPWPSLYSI